MIGIEHGDQFARSNAQAVIEVAGLGMLVAGARQIVDAQVRQSA